MRHPRTLLALAAIAALAVAAAACSSGRSSGAGNPVSPPEVTTIPSPFSPPGSSTPHPPLTPPPQGTPIGPFFFVSPTDGWLVRLGTLLHTTDGGTTWSVAYADRNFILTTMDFIDPRHGWIVGGTGPGCFSESQPNCIAALLSTADGGRTWQMSTIATTAEVRAMRFFDADDGWALTGSPACAGCNANFDVLHTTDGGASWTKVYTQPSGTRNDHTLVALDPSHALVLAAGVQYATSDGGATWHVSPSPCTDRVDFTVPYAGAASVLPPDTAWIFCGSYDAGAGNAPKAILKTEDGGATWKLQGEAGAYSPLPPGVAELTLAGGPAAVQFLDPMHGWYAVAGFGSFIFSTSDGGHTWQRIEAFSESIGELQFVDANEGWISNGYQIGRTRDAGAHWTVLALP